MATVSADKPTDAIAALLQERQRYEQWLAALESRRATTPAHVYARVHADYEGRLAHVLEELGGRSAELRQVVDALTERVTTLQGEENEERDRRSEAELRSAVGEYTPEQWREVSQTSEADIARIAARRAEAASELAQVQQLLNMATATVRRPDASTPAGSAAGQGPSATAGGPAGKPADRPSGSAGVAGLAAEAGRADPRARGGRGADHGFDELAFLSSVGDPKAESAGSSASTRAAASESAGAPTAPGSRPRTPSLPGAAAPPAVPSPGGGAATTEGPTAGGAIPRPSITPPEAGTLNEVMVPEGAPDTSRRNPNDSGSVPVFLRDVPSEQIKTLKCAECGTMNYPTEWYCDRCGGELAAM